MDRSYLIRYGVNGQVGRFAVEPGSTFQRGETVVVRSHRGLELGEVLIETTTNLEAGVAEDSGPYILRLAASEDIDRGKRAEAIRNARFDECIRVFQDGVWPIEVIDVEPLLEERRTVIHYLGPHRLEVGGILAAFRASSGLDVMLQPAGRDVADDELDGVEEPIEADSGCGSCGADGGGGGGCGSGGGCGTSSGAGGCGDCGVKKLLHAHR